jgi:hypothetical protein
MFTPRCDHAGHAELVSWPECQTCGALHEFAGWFRHRHESMAAYQYAHGLKPIGPHRALADELLGPSRTWCRQCGGSGILTGDVNRWHKCPSCEETGGYWTCTEEQLEALRGQVLERFPDAAVTRTPTNLASPGLAQNLQDGTIVDLLEDGEELDTSRIIETDEGSRRYHPPPADIAMGIPRPRPGSDSAPERIEVSDDTTRWLFLVGLAVLGVVAVGIWPHEMPRLFVGAWAAISALRDTSRRSSAEAGRTARVAKP